MQMCNKGEKYSKICNYLKDEENVNKSMKKAFQNKYI